MNVVAPTFVRTEQVSNMLEDPAFYSSLVARIPLGRIGEPADVMGAVLFLLAPASNFITGQTLISGWWNHQQPVKQCTYTIKKKDPMPWRKN